MTEEELKAIEERADASTPGPWTYRENAHGGFGVNHDEQRVYSVEILGDCRCRDGSPWKDGLKRWSSRVIAVIQDWAHWTDQPANRDFIAHARTDVPTLIAEIRSLRGALLEIRDGRQPQVCKLYEICTCVGCRASYEAFAIADRALAGKEQSNG